MRGKHLFAASLLFLYYGTSNGSQRTDANNPAKVTFNTVAFLTQGQSVALAVVSKYDVAQRVAMVHKGPFPIFSNCNVQAAVV